MRIVRSTIPEMLIGHGGVSADDRDLTAQRGGLTAIGVDPAQTSVDLLLIGPRGFVLDRQQCLKRHRSGALRTEAFAWSDVRVREYGSTAVVVVTVMQRTAYQGPDASGGAARRSARCGRTSAGAAPGANPAARFSPPSDKDSEGGSSRG